MNSDRSSARREVGRLTVITGPMFAGKTSELLRRIDRNQRRGREVLPVTHQTDDRYGSSLIASHDGQSYPAVAVSSAQELATTVARYDPAPQLVAIDEIQFFDTDVVAVVDTLLRAGTEVVAAGLCQTFDGGPFEPTVTLMTQAEDVVKLTAVCQACGRDAAFHQLLDNTLDRNGSIIGGAELYEARCRAHFTG